MALLDTLDKADASVREPYEKMKQIFVELMDSMLKYQDESGMWYQVVNVGGMDRNYLETSGSSIMAYALLKGAPWIPSGKLSYLWREGISRYL